MAARHPAALSRGHPPDASHEITYSVIDLPYRNPRWQHLSNDAGGRLAGRAAEPKHRRSHPRPRRSRHRPAGGRRRGTDAARQASAVSVEMCGGSSAGPASAGVRRVRESGTAGHDTNRRAEPAQQRRTGTAVGKETCAASAACTRHRCRAACGEARERKRGGQPPRPVKDGVAGDPMRGLPAGFSVS